MYPELQDRKHTWLITGCAGFIGSHLTETLLKNHQTVIGVDNFSSGSQSNLKQGIPSEFSKNFRFHEGDIRDRTLLKSAIKNVDFVLHHAALASVPASLENPAECYSVNVQGFAEVLEISSKSQVKKVIYASSSAVYGDDAAEKKREESIGIPLSPYASSKALNEQMAQSFSRFYGLSTMGFRYFNVFGPRQSPTGPYAAVIPLWIDAFLKGNQPRIFGDGLTSRDFCSVELVVKANIKAALSKENFPFNVVNVGSGKSTSLLELFSLISKACESLKIPLKHGKPLMQEERRGDIKHSLADCQRLKTLLGAFEMPDLAQDIKGLVSYENEKK